MQATIHGVTKSWARLSDFTSLQVAPRIPGFYHILSRMSVERCLFLSLSKKKQNFRTILLIVISLTPIPDPNTILRKVDDADWPAWPATYPPIELRGGVKTWTQ